MQTGLANLQEGGQINDLIETKISFRPFIAYLEEHIRTQKTVKAKFFEFVLQQFCDERASVSNIRIKDINKYNKHLELIYAVLSPLTVNEDEFLWALSGPASKNVLFGTDAYFALVDNWNQIEPVQADGQPDKVKKMNISSTYNVILSKYYSIASYIGERIIYSCLDPVTRLKKYYKLVTDTRFVDVLPKITLPVIDFETFNICEADGSVNSLLHDLLPLSSFYLEGFAIITLEDITAEYAADLIKKALLEHPSDQEQLYDRVKFALKILGGNMNAEFGMLPFLSVNNKLVFDDVECARSILIRAARKSGDGMANVYETAGNYLKDSVIKVYPLITDELIQANPYLSYLSRLGVKAYAVLPVYYNQYMVGILEVYSHSEMLHFELLISRLNNALPLVAQLLQNSIEQFDQRINNVIMQRFTPLQPAVQWKFFDIALEYLRSSHFGKKEAAIGKVTFKKVYPLFGAVDIRNSTVERNQALNEDISSLLNLLHNKKKHICALLSNEVASNVERQFSLWEKKIDVFLKLSDSVMLDAFLGSEVVPYLNILLQDNPAAKLPINLLEKLIEENSDEISGNRTRLERSIQNINSALNDFFEQEHQKLAAIYPCYFETFRSDGVEYDLYTGQSIAPELQFTQKHLQAFRLLQLKSMCGAVLLINEQEMYLPRLLHTTQLIYVNPHFIDISFRNDERHFDVDGAYNIRYQIIKKRIDKALVKDTSERLTQPGKIAIVYFNEDDLEEYLGYIEVCQAEGLLHKDYEMLDLEELQGVLGLRAVRVKVKT